MDYSCMIILNKSFWFVFSVSTYHVKSSSFCAFSLLLLSSGDMTPGLELVVNLLSCCQRFAQQVLLFCEAIARFSHILQQINEGSPAELIIVDCNVLQAIWTELDVHGPRR